MRVYLDACVLIRPFDDRTQLRVRLEAEASIWMLDQVVARRIELATSEVLEYELLRNITGLRHEHAVAVLGLASHQVRMTEDVIERAKHMVAAGIRPLDALHLSSAEALSCSAFCTVDDQLLRRALRLSDLAIRVVGLLDLVKELDR